MSKDRVILICKACGEETAICADAGSFTEVSTSCETCGEEGIARLIPKAKEKSTKGYVQPD